MPDTPNTSAPKMNAFIHGPLRAVYAKTALPIIFVMSLNGLLSVTDALFLGRYVGPDALAAVTLMFPVYMLVVALATLVSNGMSSLLARHLGANNMSEARAVFSGAHGLALMVALVLIVLFFLIGDRVAFLAAAGDKNLADMGLIYLRITILMAPLMFVLSVQIDTLRNEGHTRFMAAMSLLTSVANIGFNYLMVVRLDLGIAGSAYGTALAQILALLILIAFRLRAHTELRLSAIIRHSLIHSWGRILALGAPQSLNFIGISLGAAAIVTTLQLLKSPSYEDTVAAYGIITRVMTFAFLPLLGLSYAMQTITGNNYGAKQWHRSNQSLQFAIVSAFIYCASIQISLNIFAGQIGAIFVDDPAVISEVARILPVITALFFLSGPLMMIGAYFQAIGDATRASILSLAKPYLFTLPLTFILALTIGEIGIWSAGPMAEIMLLLLAIVVLSVTARQKSLRWGLFHNPTRQ